MGSSAIDVIGKLGEFVTKYTGSQYNYTDPSGEITNDYKQIGEIFGFPVWVDDNKRYENELLNFPTLGDILNTISDVGISTDIKFGDCAVCMSVSFTIPLIKYPPIIVCLSKPECKEKQKEDDRKCIPKEEYEEYLAEVNKRYDDWDEDEDGAPNFPPPPLKPMCAEKNEEEDNVGKVVPGEPGKCYWWRALLSEKTISSSPESDYDRSSYSSWYMICSGQKFYPFINEFWHGYGDSSAYFGSGRSYWSWTYYIGSQQVNALSVTRFNKQMSWVRGWGSTPSSYEESFELYISTIAIEWEERSPFEPDPYIPTPDPPGTMNDCCEEIKKLLARIDKKVTELHKVVNPQQFFKKECQMPASWIYPTYDDRQIILEDMPDYLGAIARLIDRKIGAMPQMLKVRDADPAKEGDQEVNLVFNTLGDVCRSIMEYLIATQGNIGAIQLMQLSTLHEAGLSHQLGAVNERMLKAICEYLDFESYDKKEMLPMAYNPGHIPAKGDDLGKSLPKLIKPHEQPIETMYWKGGDSIKDILMDIVKKSTFAAAAVTETRDPDKVIEEQLQLQRLLRLLQVREIDERLGIKDLKTFFDESEAAFPDSENAKQVKNKPYGFEVIDKPKFKRTTKNSKKSRYKKEKPTKK